MKTFGTTLLELEKTGIVDQKPSAVTLVLRLRNAQSKINKHTVSTESESDFLKRATTDLETVDQSAMSNVARHENANTLTESSVTAGTLELPLPRLDQANRTLLDLLPSFFDVDTGTRRAVIPLLPTGDVDQNELRNFGRALHITNAEITYNRHLPLLPSFSAQINNFTTNITLENYRAFQRTLDYTHAHPDLSAIPHFTAQYYGFYGIFCMFSVEFLEYILRCLAVNDHSIIYSTVLALFMALRPLILTGVNAGFFTSHSLLQIRDRLVLTIEIVLNEIRARLSNQVHTTRLENHMNVIRNEHVRSSEQISRSSIARLRTISSWVWLQRTVFGVTIVGCGAFIYTNFRVLLPIINFISTNIFGAPPLALIGTIVSPTILEAVPAVVSRIDTAAPFFRTFF